MLSIPHLIIIFVVALVVFGPEKLPDLARNLGKMMGEFRRATGDLRSTFEGHMRDLEREADQRRIADSHSCLGPSLGIVTRSACSPVQSRRLGRTQAAPPKRPSRRRKPAGDLAERRPMFQLTIRFDTRQL